LKPIWLADAATEAGVSVEVLIEKLVAGEFSAVGFEDGEGLPKPIPPEHFMVPLREKTMMTAELRADLIELEYDIPDGYTGPCEWVDPDYPGYGPMFGVRPATCLDIEGCVIFANGEPRWTDIQVKLPGAESETGKKAVSLDTYASYQRDTKKKTGCWASQKAEEAWAATNGYSVESVRDTRRTFRDGMLSEEERKEFMKVGRRPKNPVARN